MRTICLAVCAFFLSCEYQGGAPTHERVIESGLYTSDGASVDELADFPHGDQPKSMTIDRDAGVVRIEYDHGGEHVVETWRIATSGSLVFE